MALAGRRAVARLLLDEFIDPQHLPCQIGGRLHAFKVAKLGGGRQPWDGLGLNLSLQVRRRQAGTFMLGAKRQRCRNN